MAAFVARVTQARAAERLEARPVDRLRPIVDLGHWVNAGHGPDVASAEAGGARGTPMFFLGSDRHVGP